MNRTFISPMLVLIGLIITLALMAASSVFSPLVQFIHSETITPLQTGICIVFSMAGFAACYLLLNLICGYFVPRMTARPDEGGCSSQTNTNGGNQTNKT